ncbi:MAG: potassium transporter [Bacteroidaceae bacterium]|nr:potassium transporter [Bacteroidaceae bacterium]
MKLSDNKFLLYRNRWIYPYIKFLLGGIRLLAFAASVVVLLAVVYEHGFVISVSDMQTLSLVYRTVWIVFLVDLLSRLMLRYGNTRHEMNTFSWILAVILLLTLIPLFFHQPPEGPIRQFWLLMKSESYRVGVCIVIALVNLAHGFSLLLGRRANPSLILAISFLLIILIGTGLLLLPRCTYHGISWLDSLFLSTSAVCVTGMSPIDYTQTLTPAGMLVLMLLFQIGGLGVMTFTSFFTLFFMGNTSIYNQMMVRDVVSSNSLSSLLSTLLYILGFTLVIEGVGAFAIWTDIHGTLGYDLMEEVNFSVFHAVSAFCNAGFSTLEGGLANPLVFSNHAPLFLYLACLVILGGIGFPILVNFKDILKNGIRRLWVLLRHHRWEERKVYRQYNLNTRIVLIMTLMLLTVPTVCFAVLEWNGALIGLTVGDKLTQSFFMAVIPRSVGFAPIDPLSWTTSSMIIFSVLMWIGGASQSTAGGIKVNTFAVMLLNLRAMLRGEDRVEVFHRELSANSIRRSNGTVLTSLAVLGFSIFILNILEPELPLRSVFYECLGALSTDGFSLNATATLHDAGKAVIIPLMFIGRLGMITILMGVVKQKKVVNYRYPSGEIIIN